MNKMRATIFIVVIIVAMLAITVSVLFWESEGTGIFLIILIMSAYGLSDIKKTDNEIL